MSVSDKEVSLEEAIDEVEREMQVRTRCYDRWIKESKLSPTEARDRYDRLAAAIKYLRKGVDTPSAP